jgi:AcrR family transcriptional regulator
MTEERGAGASEGRRTQAERSAATRTKLLDATVECLMTYGYCDTTTPRIAELAGLTRGAQLHHFRSKSDMVVAAVEHLAQLRAQAVIDEVDRFDPGADFVSSVLDYVWELHEGPLFAATVELWVAARTDRVLAGEIERVEPIVNNALVAAAEHLMPGGSASKELRDFVFTAMDTLRGILLASFIDGDAGRAKRRWQRACKALAAAAPRLPETPIDS